MREEERSNSNSDQLDCISMNQLPSVSEEREREVTVGEFDLRQEIIDQAKGAERVFEQNGRCSKCGKRVGSRPRNFCSKCFSTFLSQEQIDSGEIYKN